MFLCHSNIFLTLLTSFPGGGNSNPLQYSCLKNSMDRGTWWATVCGVAKSQTQRRDWTCRHTDLFSCLTYLEILTHQVCHIYWSNIVPTPSLVFTVTLNEAKGNSQRDPPIKPLRSTLVAWNSKPKFYGHSWAIYFNVLAQCFSASTPTTFCTGQ